MKILVINSGSSSIKSSLYELNDNASTAADQPLWQAHLENAAAQRPAKLTIENGGAQKKERTLTQDQTNDPFDLIFASLPGDSAAKLDGVGHRVVHGAGAYAASVIVDDDVKKNINQFAQFAPLHNPINLQGIEAAQRRFPGVPQVAVFDTAFHHDMPQAAATYALPYDICRQYGIRRYGFHGISHQYSTHRAAHLLDRDAHKLKLVTCHLGNGCSLAAVGDGISIDTTMGFTPLDGLVMGTRSGAVDPGILLYLMHKNVFTADKLEHVLDHESGLRGISGRTADMRELLALQDAGDERASLAFDVFIHSLTGYIGMMIARLGGADAIVFTGGIGEAAPIVRARALANFQFLGVQIDQDKNTAATAKEDRIISHPSSTLSVLVVHARENWQIALQTFPLLQH